MALLRFHIALFDAWRLQIIDACLPFPPLHSKRSEPYRLSESPSRRASSSSRMNKLDLINPVEMRRTSVLCSLQESRPVVREVAVGGVREVKQASTGFQTAHVAGFQSYRSDILLLDAASLAGSSRLGMCDCDFMRHVINK